MGNAIRYDVNREMAQASLNTVYAIFLGLIGTYLIGEETSPSNGVFVLHLNPGNRAWVGVMCTYFVFDWLSANLSVARRGTVNHLVLIAVLLLIAYLGVVVVAAFGPGHDFFQLLAVYVFIVPSWDIFARWQDFRKNGGSKTILVCAILRIILGVFVACRVLVFELVDHSDHATLSSELFVWMMALVVVKITRYFAFADEAAHIALGGN